MYNELLRYLETVPVIDSHEHLPNEARRLEWPVDFFTLFCHYCPDDLLAAGLSEADLTKLQGTTAVDEKWAIFAPVYHLIADGSYARCAHLAMQRFYGMDRLTCLEDAETLSQRIQEANRPGLYQRVLKEACGIATAMNFNGTNCDREFFTPVTFVTEFADIKSPKHLQNIEQKTGQPLPTLSRYVDALGDLISKEKERGTKGLKFHFAYMRPLEFLSVPTADAERIYNRILDEGQGWRDTSLGYNEIRPLQDYLTHRLVEIAGDLDLTVVFHVGFQSRPWMKLDDTRPTLLWNLLNRYRHVRFNMLHAGIPWMAEAAVMAKQCPNLTLDLGWTQAMSPQLTTDAICTYIDLLPCNKVLGFGGDYVIVEKVYGHLCLARQNIARALAKKVSEGVLTMERAQEWGRRLLHDNVAETYRLDLTATT